ncbi:MAG: hypothetical protein ILNGONEN_00194 [Syntrophorhabdaceae bacterium]|nr:hypothetical protein [Syntrophorhabdaceae bacterium]
MAPFTREGLEKLRFCFHFLSFAIALHTVFSLYPHKRVDQHNIRLCKAEHELPDAVFQNDQAVSIVVTRLGTV